jgi:hypothetical protein
VRNKLAFAAVLAALAGRWWPRWPPPRRRGGPRPCGRVTGGTGEFAKARGQLYETFLPTGEFRFAFTLYL